MSFGKTILPLAAMVSAVMGVGATAAPAQQQGTRAQKAENARAAGDLRTRIGQADARIAAAQRSGKITASRAAALRRQVAQTRTSMNRVSRRQGFVSAAEFASYERTLGAIDLDLDRRGVERSYGNDMLPAANGQTRSFGDDALPSAEVTAFQRTDARLRYRDARIGHDARGCAVYQGRAQDGRMTSEPLLSADGRPICMRRR